MDCKFYRTCKKYGTEDCNSTCYPYIMLHGLSGTGGFYNTSNIPSRYKDCLVDNLPIKDNPINKEKYDRIVRYKNDIINLVLDRAVGIYFYGGTGTGKTTSAISLLNEFLIARVRLHLLGEKPLVNNPTLFISLAEFQNIFNSMYRGTSEMQEQSTIRYYTLKEIMKTVELLVIDDIATRDTTESFQNELFEIIDRRSAERLTTFFTSNVELEMLVPIVGERITSRIDGMTTTISLDGEDNRKGGNF